ncbi:MAG: hypothetical protein NTV01_06420 [Bacteroidia bacterium]|nr:hypothetical protein [Bacteroidia bacterium]
MQQITSVNELKAKILQLESDQKLQAEQVKNEFARTTDTLKPANLLRSAMVNLVKSPWVMLIGINTIKSFGHRLIDKICSALLPRDQPVS